MKLMTALAASLGARTAGLKSTLRCCVEAKRQLTIISLESLFLSSSWAVVTGIPARWTKQGPKSWADEDRQFIVIVIIIIIVVLIVIINVGIVIDVVVIIIVIIVVVIIIVIIIIVNIIIVNIIIIITLAVKERPRRGERPSPITSSS